MPPTKEEVQTELIIKTLGEAGTPVGRGANDDYLFADGYMLARDDYVPRVTALLEEMVAEEGGAGAAQTAETPAAEVAEQLIMGVSLLRLDRARVNTIRACDRVRTAYGPGICTPNHILSVSGNAAHCPATEPEFVSGGSAPDPGRTTDRAAGEGVRVVVIDTGLDAASATRHAWLKGVTGDPDPAALTDPFGPYAGHGTFIAGVVRSPAPLAEVHVRAFFGVVGAIVESELVKSLNRALDEDRPDIISMSAGTRTYDATGLLGFQVFYETRLRHHKGVVLVVAAGNDADREPFWPAAAPWTVSVGALATNYRTRASFSNFGGWVDVYAPGEDLVNAFPIGTYEYIEPPNTGTTATFDGMARWSGTSFSTPLVAGLVAARMSRTGENGLDAAAALLTQARAGAQPGVGAVLLPA